MGSPRIRGNRLALVVDATNRWADASHVAMICESDSSRLEDGRIEYFNPQWTLEITAIQSTAASSLWSLMWDRSGETVPFVYAPHGNPTPTTDQPHFTGNAQIPFKPRLGGEASIRGDYTFDAVLHIVGEPTKITS